MARSVKDAAVLMGSLSDIDLQGCNLDVSTCLPKKVIGNRTVKCNPPAHRTKILDL